jgi:predicted PurR-regulated permease PerM
VFLFILAGALIGIFFRGLSGLICRKMKWKEGYCLAVSISVTFILIAGIFWLIGSKVQDQISEHSETHSDSGG